MWKHIYILFFFLPAIASAQKADSLRGKLNDTLSMEGVTIRAKVAMQVKGDTVSYTVDSFNKNPDAGTEDVLKRLPGIEVTTDGKIMVQGKEVTKVFVNGKEYRAADLRTLTQNMPAGILEKIQLADWYDEDAQFSGIKGNATEKSLNLKIKKQYEQGVYGQAAAGYGTKDRCQGGVFANYMGRVSKLTAIGKVSNTGMSDGGSGSSDNIKPTTSPAAGVNTKQQANLNYSYDKGKKLKLTANYDLTNTHNTLRQSSQRTTYLPGDSLLLLQQARIQETKSPVQHLNMRGDYKIDERNSMETNLAASYREGNSTSISDDKTFYNTTDELNFRRNADVQNGTNGYALNFSEVYRKKFRKKGRTLMLSAKGNFNKDNTNSGNTNTNQFTAPPATSVNQYESEEKRNNLSTNIGFQYTEPFTEKSSVSFKYTNNYTRSGNERMVYAVNNGVKQVDTIQSRDYDNRNTENPVSLTYQYQTDKLRLNTGLDVQPYSRRTEQTGVGGSVLSQSGVNYFPNLSASYNPGERTNMSLNYSGGLRSPEINQLQPVPDYRDSLNIYTGNPNLRPELSNNLSARYSFTDKKSQHMLWLNIRTNWVNNKIINKTELNASRRITTPVNANGNNSFNMSANYSRPFFVKKLKVTISVNGGLTNNVNITNGTLQKIPNYSLQPGLKLVYTSDWYEGDMAYTYRYNTINSAGAVVSNFLQVHTLSNGGVVTLRYKWRVGYYLNYVLNLGLPANFDKDFLLANLTVDKGFSKLKGLSARVQALDIFNSYPNVQRTTGDNYFEDKSVNRIGSYFMFSLIYKFTYFPGKG